MPPAKYGFHNRKNYFGLNKSEVKKNIGGISHIRYSAEKQFRWSEKKIKKEMKYLKEKNRTHCKMAHNNSSSKEIHHIKIIRVAMESPGDSERDSNDSSNSYGR